MLPAPLSKIDVEGDTVAAVTDTARQAYLDQVSMVISITKILLQKMFQVLPVGDP